MTYCLVSLNTAHDVGGHIFAVAIWGSKGDDHIVCGQIEHIFTHEFAAAGALHLKSLHSKVQTSQSNYFTNCVTYVPSIL